MLAAIPFPNIGPDIFSVSIGGFDFALRWYAMAYIVGIVIGWRMAVAAARAGRLWAGGVSPVTPEDVEDLLTAVIIGIIVGGRLGYVLFYQPEYYFANPGQILVLWEGGMAFHGGVLGVVAAGAWFVWRKGIPAASLADLIAYATPPGLLLGRTANFINAELWGAPTTLPWGVIFPGTAAQNCPGIEGLCARHPSQLYEALLEGLVLGLVLLWMVWRRGALTSPGRVAGTFFLGYGLARFAVEFLRQADAQFITADNPAGYVVRLAEWGMTMGQVLSLPMIAIGLLLLMWSARRRQPA
ncbi:MAG: prolipoprotein diacylglyceryl transferase [Paracoccaceae bacterium]|nr:prolipoprotein diacylglyceryl transferase [Paracoccaceae bacterium]